MSSLVFVGPARYDPAKDTNMHSFPNPPPPLKKYPAKLRSELHCPSDDLQSQQPQNHRETMTFDTARPSYTAMSLRQVSDIFRPGPARPGNISARADRLILGPNRARMERVRSVQAARPMHEEL